MSNFSNPTAVSHLTEIENLPVFSVIEADGILYEKGITSKNGKSSFIELGYGTAEIYTVTGEDLAENVADGKVKILLIK